MDGGIKRAHTESSALFQFTLSDVMKNVEVPHRPLLYFPVKLQLSPHHHYFMQCTSLLSLPKLELFL